MSDAIGKQLIPVIDSINMLEIEIADMIIATDSDRQDSDAILKRLAGRKKAVDLLKSEFIVPVKKLAKELEAKLKPAYARITNNINAVKVANETYDTAKLLKHREEQRRIDAEREAEEKKRQAEALAEIKKRQDAKEDKIVTPEIAKQMLPLPKKTVGITPVKRTEHGTTSVRLVKKWRVKKLDGSWWDKRSRLRLIDVTHEMVRFAEFLAVDNVAINRAFDAGKTLPPWVEAYEGTVESVRGV